MQDDGTGTADGTDRSQQAPHPHQKHLAGKTHADENVCLNCLTEHCVQAFYKQYDDFVIAYNEKFAKPGQAIMQVLYEQKLLSPKPAEFDDAIEWTWYLLWQHVTVHTPQ